MKQIVLLIFIVTILESCDKKSINSDLLGSWTSTKSASIVELKFYKDSLIVHQWGKVIKNNWTSNSSIIFFEQLTEIDPQDKTRFELGYKLNLKKDTLFIKNETDSVFTNAFSRSKI